MPASTGPAPSCLEFSMSNVLAVDIGGTKVAAGIVDSHGRPSHKNQIQTVLPDAEQLYPRLLSLVKETLDAVDKGLIDCGFAWTHYWSGEHPAAMLFGSPVAGAGVGIDNIAFLSWFQYGGGKELYDQLWKEMKRDVKGLMLQPVGPEALGWFKEPINSMDDFRKYKFRTPPGIPGQTYKDIGVASVAMGGGDILPALEAGTIDAAEWCCPKPDSVFGFQKVLKHYYLQGLHQVVVNADLYINGKVWRGLTDHERKAMEVAADASLSKSMSYRIYENGKALHELLNKHGVILHDTPADYFPAYMAAAKASLEKNAKENQLGLWALPEGERIPPWQWRKNKRQFK